MINRELAMIDFEWIQPCLGVLADLLSVPGSSTAIGYCCATVRSITLCGFGKMLFFENLAHILFF